ncbi:Hypothetical predicted protein [Scomber scombrus]|uniref:Uncharacterized protein n=1 Tax=Scomber scombrus TaxID=13677 RepID=A0AAV1Q147_SCOSC
MFAVFGTAGGGNRDVGRDLVRSRLVQQHRCAPRRQTPSLPLHSPHRHSRSCPSVRLLFSACDGKVPLKFQIPRWKEGEASEECSSLFTPSCFGEINYWMEEMSKRHRLQLSSARGHSSRRGSAGKGVPVHSAIMMLTGRGGWGY